MIDKKTNPLRYAKEVVGGDPFASLLGIVIEDVKTSYAKASLTIKNEYCNSEMRTHGGVIFALADETFAVAANSMGYTAFGLEMKINYFQATGPGDKIIAEAVPIDLRKRVSLWNVEIKNDRGEKIAVAHGMAYHFVD